MSLLAPRNATRCAGLVLLSTTVVVTGCASASFRESRAITVAHQADAPLRVRTANGSITVKRGEAGDVTISAELKAISAERLASAAVVAEREADGTLAVSVDWPDDRKSNEGCSFSITLPGAKGVELDTSNGRVVLSGQSGQADLESSNGPITVEGHDGSVNINTSNGGVRLSRIAGDAIVETSNGSIRIDGLEGAGDARTSNSGVEVLLADSSRGPINVESSNGSVQLDLGRAFTGELSLQTSNGRVNVENPQGAKLISMSPKSVRLRFGEAGGESSTVTTTNGSITLRSK